MIPRGSGRRVGLVIVITGVLIVGITLLAYRSPAAPKGPANPATSTLNVALPGPFNGCSVLSPSATATTSAILDLIRPSAFLTGPTNVLYGEGGAIVSAELISLHPETVVYSVATKMTWSNGQPFQVSDLIDWWRSARSVLSINGDGYRDISSMVVNKTATAVTATFSTDFADWNLLFRDVEAAGTTRSCQVSQLRTQPSLGPYRVQSATPSRIVLISNPEWTIDYNRFHRVVITSSTALPTSGSKYFVKYAAVATPALVSDLVAHPRYLGEFSDSSDIVELTYSPISSLTRQSSVRTALSWLLERKSILTTLFGGLTFSPSVPTSALFSQGQANYPPPNSTVVPTAENATLVDPSQDCRSCASTILRRLGYVHDARGWRSTTGGVLHLTLAQGPSSLDHVTARLVDQQWTSQGINVTLRSAASDDQAAFLASSGAVDAAVFDRPTSTTAWVSARSWGQTPYIDSYPSGVRSSAVNKLFTLAQGTFNPATAALTWLEIDHIILTNFWVRPLYTVPSFISWSSPMANVVSAESLSGFVDQLTNWGIATPSTTTTVGASTSPIG
jgi:hypothetical protein